MFFWYAGQILSTDI